MGSDLPVISYSELASYRQCPKKWDYEYRQRWRSDTTSPALSRGTLFHQCMEVVYLAKAGKESPYTLADLLVNRDGSSTEEQDLVRWMLDGYIEYYSPHGELDPTWEVITVENEIRCELPGGQFIIKLKLDAVMRDGSGRTWVWDHKTCRNIPKGRAYELDDQFGLYTWGMRKAGMDVHGAVYNAVRSQRNKDPSTQPLESRFHRELMYRTDAELKQIAVEAAITAEQAYSQGDNPPRFTNPDTCGWKCSFTDACLHGRKGYDDIDFLSTGGFRQDFTRH